MMEVLMHSAETPNVLPGQAMEEEEQCSDSFDSACYVGWYEASDL